MVVKSLIYIACMMMLKVYYEKLIVENYPMSQFLKGGK